MHYPALTPERHRARKALGWKIADEGGNMRDFARAAGISAAAISKWLDYWPDLHGALIDGRRQSTVSTEIAEHRLRTVALSDIAGRSRSSAARELGLSPAGLYYWLRRREGELFDTINEIQSERRAA
jgi:transposase-like protein